MILISLHVFNFDILMSNSIICLMSYSMFTIIQSNKWRVEDLFSYKYFVNMGICIGYVIFALMVE